MSTHTHTPLLFADESESESELEEDGGAADQPLKTMDEKLRELNTAHDLVVKNSHQLIRLITEVEEGALVKPNFAKLKEKLTLFKLTTTAMVKVCLLASLLHAKLDQHTTVVNDGYYPLCPQSSYRQLCECVWCVTIVECEGYIV